MTQDLSDLKLEEWERIAREAAKAGSKWSGKIEPQHYPECDDADLPFLVKDERGRCVAYLPEAHGDRYRPYEEDGEFISTFDPATALSLLSALKEAREALRPFAGAAAEMADLPEGWAVLLRPRDYAAERGATPVSDFRRASHAFTTLGGSEHER